MSTQTTRTVSDSDRDYALDLFASLSPADQAEIIALAVSAVTSPPCSRSAPAEIAGRSAGPSPASVRLLLGAVFVAFFRQVCYGYIRRCQ